jgi:deoxyadenosine/deoxycytidine kinase
MLSRRQVMKRFITVAGNIGVGKSTLVKLLSSAMGWKPFYEPEAQNPYLSDFYRDMSTWSFHSQIFFLINRLRIHQELTLSAESALQDRSIYEDAEIFARNLYLQGHMQARDYNTYQTLYQSLCSSLIAPDLVIYLKASVQTLQKRISLRSRTYEQSISSDYLERINVLYEEWIDRFALCPKLTIPADNLDYVSEPRHLNLILRKIQDILTGKKEVVFQPGEIENL